MSWLLIAFAISVIFGVIKVEDLKNLGKKALPKLKDIMDQAASKTAEFKEKLNAESDEEIENKKNQTKSDE